MRALALLCLLAAAAGCVVPLTGAPCETDDNCPRGQTCSAAKTCEVGTSTAPDAGPSCVTDPLCSGSAATVCDASGKVATCEEVSPGCRKVKTTVGCALGQVCQDGACRCSSGCAKDETACSAAGKLQTCSVAAGAECGTFVEADCDPGLVCTSASGPARCVCGTPEPAGTLYVDPASAQPALEPTGALEPAACRFARLTDALAQAASLDPTLPVSVTVKMTESPTPVVLANESFPLVVPPGVQVLAEGCPSPLRQGDPPCDSSRLVIFLGESAAGETAVTLGNGASLSGATLKSAGTTSAAFLRCDSGSFILQDVAFVGGDGAPPSAAQGLLATGSCKPYLSRVAARSFAVAGLAVDGAEANLTVMNGKFDGNAIGLDLRRGYARVAPWDPAGAPQNRPEFVANEVAISVGKPDSAEVADLTAEQLSMLQNKTGLLLVSSAGAKAKVDAVDISSHLGIDARGGELALSFANLTGGDTGLRVSGAIVSASDTVVSGQIGNGIEVLSTARDVILSRVHVTGNGAAGIKHSSGTLAVFDSEIDGHVDDGVKVLGGTVELGNTKVHDNGVYGVSVAGAEASIHDCDIYANGNKNAGGGLGFVGEGASLGLFFSNKLHGNFRAQMYVGVAPAAGTSWKISSTTCSSTINKLYCYATDAYGLLVENTTVAANNVSWMHSPPTTADRDLRGNVTLSPATAYCSVTACP